ncbi:COMM domain-containing protein 2 [Salarias fasciatus]|uniref:COMM domain-containing protein n=1 Tax=Salarias fasciatus TaxID=181472 RepID=A0A672FKB3_SALFA|nr:COMM domain-containing protein 2 [Salarias fasciatus]
MLLSVSEEQRRHLAFLRQVDESVVAEFGRIALEFLRRGSNPKTYEGAARKLGVSMETVRRAVEGLMFLVTDSAKHALSERDFLDSVSLLGLGGELNHTLLQLYLKHSAEVCGVLRQLSCAPPAYRDLHWRLDVQLASRAARQQLIPRLTLSLRRSGGAGTGAEAAAAAVVLQVDAATLLRLVSALEDALHAARSGRARRLARSIK